MAVRTSYVGTQAPGDVLTSANFDKLPGGWIGYVEDSDSQTITNGTEAEVTGTAVTVTVGDSRRIKVTARGGILNVSGGGGGIAALYIAQNDFLMSALATDGPGTDAKFEQKSVVLTPSSGSIKYSLRALRIGGTGDVFWQADVTNVGFVLVEDVGPAS